MCSLWQWCFSQYFIYTCCNWPFFVLTSCEISSWLGECCLANTVYYYIERKIFYIIELNCKNSLLALVSRWKVPKKIINKVQVSEVWLSYDWYSIEKTRCRLENGDQDNLKLGGTFDGGGSVGNRRKIHVNICRYSHKIWLLAFKILKPGVFGTKSDVLCFLNSRLDSHIQIWIVIVLLNIFMLVNDEDLSLMQAKELRNH